MTKRRTPRTTTSSTPTTTTRTTTNEELAAFGKRLEELVDYYLEQGCPCRFPRFRAHQSRDTREVGAPGWSTWEQQGLMQVFDRRVPLINREGHNLGHTGECSICGARVKRWGEERFRDAWLEHMEITPKLPDLGAGVHGPIPRANDLYAVGPIEREGTNLAVIHYPKIPADDWFAYMRELK
jgi:hypothetical protein